MKPRTVGISILPWLLLGTFAVWFLSRSLHRLGYLLNVYFPGKTLWDYLDVFLVPVLIFGFGFVLDRSSKIREESRMVQAESARVQDGKDAALQSYYDRISLILLDDRLSDLMSSKEPIGDASANSFARPARDVIRARTLAILRSFSGEKDRERRNLVFRFLLESEILDRLRVSLRSANLSGVYFGRVCLTGVDFSHCDLSNADMSGAHFEEAFLVGASLRNAILPAVLHGDLRRVDFGGANFSGVDLIGSDLCGANMQDITWDNETLWPDQDCFHNAINIPSALILQLGL
jgi:hypothetical protein